MICDINKYCYLDVVSIISPLHIFERATTIPKLSVTNTYIVNYKMIIIGPIEEAYRLLRMGKCYCHHLGINIPL